MTVPRPSAAEAAGFGGKPPPRRLGVTFKAYRNPAGTMRGFVNVTLPNGMIVNDCKLMIGPQGRWWLALPATKQLNADGSPRMVNGKACWKSIIDFADRPTRQRFEELVLEALRRQHPDAFAGEPSQ